MMLFYFIIVIFWLSLAGWFCLLLCVCVFFFPLASSAGRALAHKSVLLITTACLSVTCLERQLIFARNFLLSPQTWQNNSHRLSFKKSSQFNTQKVIFRTFSSQDKVFAVLVYCQRGPFSSVPREVEYQFDDLQFCLLFPCWSSVCQLILNTNIDMALLVSLDEKLHF